MKKTLRTMAAIMVIVLCLTGISFAETDVSNQSVYENSSTLASSAYLIRMGGNYQVWSGVPSSFANLSWSSWSTKTTSFDAVEAGALLTAMADAVRTKYSKWKLLSLGFLVSDLNEVASDAFLLNIINDLEDETAYSRIKESHASSSSGTLQYSKVYLEFYSDSNYTNYIGSSDIILLYSWPTGSRIAE